MAIILLGQGVLDEAALVFQNFVRISATVLDGEHELTQRAERLNRLACEEMEHEKRSEKNGVCSLHPWEYYACKGC